MSVELLEELKQLHAQGGSSIGICHSVYCWHGPELAKLFTSWPKYSGDDFLPIPGGVEAYAKAYRNDTMWDRNTEYGALRWELLEWLIEELQK